MRREKYLTAALCCCGLALCVAVGIALHFQQESRERQELLTEARERQELLTEAREQIELMEVELAQAGEQLTLAEEARADAEKERDYAQRQYEWATERDNPIDRYYDSDKRPMVITTFDMSMAAWFEYEAWRREFECALTWVEADCGTIYEEDKQLLADYRAAIEAQARAVYDLTYLHVAQSYPPEERLGNIGSMGASATSSAQAEVYRLGTCRLLDVYAYAMDSKYPYFFDEEARKEIIDRIACDNESIRESLEQLFPPVSQILPD